MKGLELEWRRIDSETLVHLFIYSESRPEEQHEDYHDRAHFFTDQIQHGNFSILLNNLTAEDKGLYRCKVYTELNTGETFVEIKAVVLVLSEYLLVSGSDESIFASVGEDVTLNCSVDSHIPPENTEQMSDTETEFFTDEIPKGNVSLRLKSVRTEDKGVYMCQVSGGGLSVNTTVIIERLGFSVLHKMILALCITSGSALLLCHFTYCRLQIYWTGNDWNSIC
ncbi:V-set domain-containing T-cell activation inhibitor 1 [Labeo rohita]|uniref:V-set domain-containing T-cell activation inhibitor 1 n=1 Tax=Labeo rohita TaxID=84645 RepID=A0ABQ8MX38_LABRO|nr:V-set domain-containing T-cell activation inhibitor 1 [Labeo rohita]